ncbi:phospholipase B1, membrane-associated-like [Melanotaenia boesemani]|uniref:phospholipase B1, membrane-associated-like n=1 Tax=Melanotaenia boesemani TaxID=1250792 RepID=UPI001C04B53D|nr:phospholipase B1, membrane-associated-like [Melanotaenia boesemani]
MDVLLMDYLSFGAFQQLDCLALRRFPLSSLPPLKGSGIHNVVFLCSTELSKVLSRLRELLTVFSPGLISQLSDETESYSPQLLPHSTLVEQAKEVSLYLRSNKDIDVNQDWKLVLLFIQVDQLCACEQQQVLSDIKKVVEDVDEALQLMHTQESLDELMVQKHWYRDRDDFTVTLQDTPFIRDPPSVANGKPLSEFEELKRIDDLMVQMWTNLLQPTDDQHKTADNRNIITLPCPTEDQPFLRTEGNSPSYHHSEVSVLSQALPGTDMPCEDLGPSASTPTSVHELRPGDIKVVAAVGDSLTAGNGIASSPNNILDVLRQYRGLSWSIGGDENLTTVTTLPNILKHFNHNLTGYSVGVGKQDTPQAFLNQAVAGAKSKDVPSQVQALVARMKNDPRINFESDWKLITVFIGGNDACEHCRNSLLFSVENYIRNVQESLDFLHKEVPRALVNLVESIHISPLREMHIETSLKCPTWLVNILCPCVVLPKPNSEALLNLENINKGYQHALHEIVESGRYDTRSDFTVVIQPFFREIVVPRQPDGRPDRSFFSADCFHLSLKAQTLMARSLWNNMLEPVGNKTAKQVFNTSATLKCPTKTSPFIRTYNNSNYIYSGPSPTPGPITNWGSDFSCGNVSPSDIEPTSVHKLRPSDIQVVAALGDSITAGTGAKSNNLLELNQDYGGVSWSIGGDQSLDTVTTLPNILMKFNPFLKGVSKGQGSRQKGFNMAVPGAKISELPAQVQTLINAMKENKEVNFEKDWKLVTIFIGGNDLCSYCLDQNNLSPKNYSHNLQLSLDMLSKEIPRLLVNVVEIMQINWLKSVQRNTLGCSLLQRISCPCVINPTENSPEFEEIRQINYEYQTELNHLISGDRYDRKEDFAVVLQPFLHNSFIPQIGVGEPDPSFFSVDCFHISERAHAEMAIALWNNMLEPVGKKQTYNNFTYDRSKIHCPSEARPFIFTKINSLSSLPVSTIAPNTTTTITSPSTVPKSPSSTPVWVPVVVGIVSLLAGIAVSWIILGRFQRQKNKNSGNVAETKGTGF